jgi:amino acid permease
MMKALLISYALVIVAYLCVGCAGFAAFGWGVNADVLLSIQGFDFWVNAADLMVVVHVAASWQVFSMPVFEDLEAALAARGALLCRDEWVTRVVARSGYCLMCWAVATWFPNFGDLLGVIGAVGFTPMSFILPCVMWQVHHAARRSARPAWEAWLNWGIVGGFGIVGLLAAAAAVQRMVV